MMLRIMLLGLVASMGFELPRGSDLTRWTQSGRDWVDARVANPSVSVVEAEKPCVGTTDCLQANESCHAPMVVERPNTPEDQAFEAVSNKIAADFTADLVVAKADKPQPTEPEPVIVATEESPAVGLPSGEELATQVIVESQVEVVEVAQVVIEPTVPVEVTEVTEARNERLDRIAAAVRLTKDAVHAWAEVIQDPVDETSPTH